MIIIGGIGFYLDSIFNVIIETTGNNNTTNCMLSIFCTMAIHYIGYMTLIFRAERIFKVMKLEKKYLDRLYKLASTDSIKGNKFTGKSLNSMELEKLIKNT